MILYHTDDRGRDEDKTVIRLLEELKINPELDDIDIIRRAANALNIPMIRYDGHYQIGVNHCFLNIFGKSKINKVILTILTPFIMKNGITEHRDITLYKRHWWN